MADTIYPVWSIKPNWANGITETLEWLTDILQGDDGNEQRRSIRVSPRRSFEFTVNPIDEERTFMDLSLNNLSTGSFMLPLWHDKARLDLAASAGDVRLHFDNNYREFVTGGQAIIYQDAFTYDVVNVTGQDADGLNVSALSIDAKKGFAVYPLAPAYILDKGSYSSLSPRVGQAQIKFTLDQANDLDPGPEVQPILEGSPIFTKQPDWSDGIQFDLNTVQFSVDSGSGLTYRTQASTRSFTQQSWSAWAVGRAQQRALRQMLYRQRGRQRDLWMPSFNRDVRLAAPAAGGQKLVDIRKVGLEYIGGPKPGRQRLWFPKTGESTLITNLGAAPTAAIERLVMSANLANNYAADDYACFLSKQRFDSDSIEINHAVDSDGPINVKIPVRMIADTRDPSGPINYPIPAAVNVGGQCGKPEDGTCDRVFAGWYWRIIWQDGFTGGDLRNPAIAYLGPAGIGPGYQDIGFSRYDDGQYWTYQWLLTEDYDPHTSVGQQSQAPGGMYNSAVQTEIYYSGSDPDHDGKNSVRRVSVQYWTWPAPQLRIYGFAQTGGFPQHWQYRLDGSAFGDGS